MSTPTSKPAASPYTEQWLAGPQGTQFYTRMFPAPPPGPRAGVVFVHGFADHVGRQAHVHARFAAAGVAVFAFDLRGFGRTAQDEARRSKGSRYGKTSWREQLEDIEWALGYFNEQLKGAPLFLMGHSMGGALALAFATRSSPPPSPSAVTLLKGVIASSPLIHQTHPVSRIIRWVGAKAALVLPTFSIPAVVNAEDLSHDPTVVGAHHKDKLIKPQGTLRCLDDMLDGGEELLRTDYARWPKDLPILFLHGVDDQVTCPTATEQLYTLLPASDKHLSLYPGGLHELFNEPNGVRDRFIAECVAWMRVRAGAEKDGGGEAGGESKA